MDCKECGGPVGLGGRRGRMPAYCSSACRQRAYRKRRKRQELPSAFSGERWVRAVGKRPIQVDGSPASSTDSSTWASLSEVKASAVGDGLGVMLGAGLGCYDLDSVSDAEAREIIAGIPETIVFAERSVSGRGVHVFVEAPEGRGSRRGKVERYTRSRFIRMTFNEFLY